MIAEHGSRQKFSSACTWIAEKLERNAGIAAILALLLIFVLALGQSADKLLWYDELVTLKTASLQHWSDIWKFYDSGFDTTGPMQSFVARAGLMLPIGPELGSRLPFTFAYLVMCWCIYRFVHHRYPAGYALAAMIYPLHHVIFYYATEARAYALVLAGTAVAMLSWQSAVSGLHRRWSLFCLWLGLAFAVAAHAFAIFLFLPFALAQLARDFRRKKPDWAVWAALILFPLGILPVLHGEMNAKFFYGSSFSSQPEIQTMFNSYQDFFFAWLSYSVALLLVAIGAFLFQRWRRPDISEVKMSGFILPEWVLAAMFALLPVFVVPIAYLLHVYYPRYVIGCNIGLIVLAVAAVAETARRSRLAGVALFALFLLASAHNRAGTLIKGLNAIAHPDRVHEQLQARYNNFAWVKLLEQSRLPVLTDSTHVYTQLDYYAKPDLKQRLIGVTDIRDIKKYSRTAYFQIGFLRVLKNLSYRSADLADVLPEHPHFLLVEENSAGQVGWMPGYLSAQQKCGNASYACIGPDCAGTGMIVYDVQLTRMPSRTANEPMPDSAPVR